MQKSLVVSKYIYLFALSNKKLGVMEKLLSKILCRKHDCKVTEYGYTEACVTPTFLRVSYCGFLPLDYQKYIVSIVRDHFKDSSDYSLKIEATCLKSSVSSVVVVRLDLPF